jgi:hypothetical protein
VSIALSPPLPPAAHCPMATDGELPGSTGLVRRNFVWSLWAYGGPSDSHHAANASPTDVAFHEMSISP